MIRPQPLREGDKVAIVSPAGAVQQPSIIEGAARTLESWGLNVVVAPHALARHGYFAGSVEERTADMRMMLNDTTIKAIICSYGGYGCIHLLPQIIEDIAENPKWIAGMSDCSLLLSAATTAGVVSLHSCQCRHLAESSSDSSSEYMRKVLFGQTPQYVVPTHPMNRMGEATGMLVGGNLSVLCGVAGTPYDTIRPGRILFIEDINEPPHKVERMLYTLKLSGALGKLAALIVGNFSGCKENEDFGGTLYEIIKNMVTEYSYPVCFNFPVGHTGECYPLPVGDNAQLTVCKSGVRVIFNK